MITRVDDYSKEIIDLRAQIDAMRMAEEGNDPKEISELQMQLDILSAIHARAVRLHEQGRGDAAAARGLALRGYGDWTLDNVYAFVYETAVDVPSEGHHAFLEVIRSTDFAALLDDRGAE